MKVYLETDRLILRDMVPEDWEAVYAYASDPEVTRFMFEPQAPEIIRKAVVEQARQVDKSQRNEFSFAIALKAENRLIGDCTLLITGHPLFHPRQGMIHYCIHRDFWNQGIATEAVGALMRFAFEELRLHRLHTKLATENGASIRVLEKNGFRREGLFREEAYIKGQWHDEYTYAILDHEWRSKPSEHE